jgi:5-methylcytosine-specific restriction endonuclease McrA
MSRRIDCVCATCSAAYSIPLSQARRGQARYCSNDCRPKATRVEIACEWCGASRLVLDHVLTRGGGKYCSPRCGTAARAAAGRVTLTCQNSACGGTFVRTRDYARKNIAKYCSTPCAAEGRNQQVERSCENPECGKTFRVSPSALKFRRATCCSEACRGACSRGSAHPFWRGGSVEYRGPNWRRQSRAARARDGHRCRLCGAAHPLHVHHIRPFRTFSYIPRENDHYKQANQLSNLVTLCASCHTTAERRGLPFHLWVA